MWSPMTNSNGARNQFYEFMKVVEPGDIVFSFAETYIKAIGVATSRVQECPKPDFGNAGSYWANLGWLVEVEYQELDRPFKPKDFITDIAPLLPDKYSPLQKDGRGLQGVYLALLPDALGALLLSITGSQFTLAAEISPQIQTESLIEQELEKLEQQVNVPEPIKLQLVRARYGQGLFKTRVRAVESFCRVTGVFTKQHLEAAHIKPWNEANTDEKLDGNNGLLLSPHIHHLFDKGLLTFEDNGSVLLAPALESDVREGWSLDREPSVKPFNSDQRFFLDYHRRTKFKTA